MKNIITAIMASASLFSAQAAYATTYTPAGTWTFQGTVTVQKGAGPILNCLATATFVVPEAAPDVHGAFSHGHSLTGPTTLSIGPGDPGCATIRIVSNPHTSSSTTSPTGQDPVVINNVDVDTTITPGDCFGNLHATVVPGAPPALEVDTVLPAVVAGTGDCTIIGALDLLSPVGGSVTP